MNRRLSLLLASCALTAILPLIAQGPSAKSGAVKSEHKQTEHKQEQSRGERVFKQNCARCHEPPQSFPPQISGTIIRHMRVRASLSAADEKVVLEFMNP